MSIVHAYGFAYVGDIAAATFLKTFKSSELSSFLFFRLWALGAPHSPSRAREAVQHEPNHITPVDESRTLRPGLGPASRAQPIVDLIVRGGPTGTAPRHPAGNVQRNGDRDDARDPRPDAGEGAPERQGLLVQPRERVVPAPAPNGGERDARERETAVEHTAVASGTVPGQAHSGRGADGAPSSVLDGR